ncbi:sortase [Candidatus Saccharibacteria bacterium]|nr:sortase [Candidatus Saccharibacteria bacterium]
MEIGKRLNPRYIFFGLYIFAFLVYIVVGLQPAEAANYQISAKLIIPTIELNSDVTSLKIENHELKTPDTIVGSYSGAENKTLLIGHSSTVFNNLENVKIGDEIIYDDVKYIVGEREIVEKDDVVMPELLESSEIETIVIMTCAGEDLGMGDATHRLIITAEQI